MEFFKKIYDNGTVVNHKGHSYYFNNVKFFLILLVVIGHFVSTLGEQSDAAQALDLWIYSFHMPAFIFMSGFLSKGCAKSPKKALIRSGTFLGIYMIAQIVFDLLQRFVVHSVKSPFTFLKPRIGLWYLVVLIVYTIMLPVLSEFKARYVLPGLVAGGMLTGFNMGIGEKFSLSRMLVFWAFFMAGYYADQSWFERVNRIWVKQWAQIFLLFFAEVCYLFRDYIPRDILLANTSYAYVDGYSIIRGFYWRGIWYVVAALMMIAFFSLVPQGKFCFSGMGERTLQIYLIHSIVVRMLYVAGVITDFEKQMGIGTVILTAVMFTFILGTKPVTHVWHFPKKVLANLNTIVYNHVLSD